MLDLDMITGHHTGKNLASSLCKVLASNSIIDKVISIKCDNVSNCDAFVKEFETKKRKGSTIFGNATTEDEISWNPTNAANLTQKELAKGNIRIWKPGKCQFITGVRLSIEKHLIYFFVISNFSESCY
ncbi:unnamed protein product [Allacma fusca]|uniref:Uncharacterized protein n=1 Tax=Allacma fusca TaxID=39272 RepID=A0A8J2PN42_9HEXA|nr:unnamed protein product [Allacma fusca]